MELESFDRTAKAVAILPVLSRDGAVILRELVPEASMDSLVARVSPALGRRRIGGGEFFGYRRRSLGALFAQGPEFCELLLHPTVLELADGVLGPHCNHYQVHATGVIEVWGGGQDQPLHREQDAYGRFLRYDPEGPEHILFFMWAGSEFTRENGATRLVPGSHRWPYSRRASEEEVARAVMPRGSVVVWLGKTLHGLGASRADEPRTGISFSLSVGWLRQEENQYLAVPPEVARELPERVQQLLGYRAHADFLGWVDGRDNELLLRERRRAG